MELDLTPITSERLSPEEFVKVFESERVNIKNIRINPPSVGDIDCDDGDFGSLEVEYKTPKYHVVFGRD